MPRLVVALDFSQSVNWTVLLNEVLSELTGDPLCPQSYVNSALPEIDLSIPQLPLVWATEATYLGVIP